MWKSDKLLIWLSTSETKSSDKRYTHRLFREDLHQRSEIFETLKTLVQLAHDDARRHFKGVIANTLNPFDSASDYDFSNGYPQFLPLTTLKGYFGEILAGLIAENFSPFGIANWQVPAFLFRFHDAAFNELERAKITGEHVKAIFGRTGNDCLAFELSNEGYVRRSLVCEAKCTSSHDTEMIAAVHGQVSDLGFRPESLWQIVHILKDRLIINNDRNAGDWILALEILQQGTTSTEYERCDLITYICGQFPKRKNQNSWLCGTEPHENYVGGRRLEAVEIHLHEVDKLVREIYTASGSEAQKPTQAVSVNEKAHDELVNLVQELREKLTSTLGHK
jgi:hypothetical protein